jgi:ankyrin repeat protein
LAIFEKNIKSIIVLLEYGSRTDIIYPVDNLTPIHFAILLGHQAILKILLDFSSKEIINKFTKKIEAPLHLAILENDLSIIKLLIEYGADINQKNNNGYTALDIARSKSIENQNYTTKEIIDYLIKNKGIQTFDYFRL